MAEIRIVEYENRLAGRIADMWNRSAASWGGSSTVRTEENVLREHENSTLLTVFIAMDGEEVVGYCSFSEYNNDEGALFIPLLNVRPDYHGKKVGKALVLKAVERTIQMGWPRLDLFTWPGNTKAVPVYKKCGFFWEERDDSTHLMNFIPTIVQTEAFEEFFQKAHWYDDSKRVIEIKPDGRKENGFTYYEYYWEKEKSFLRVEFEKTARGIRLIETEDYLISATVQEHGLVFGRSYRISYHLTNKSGLPLEVTIKGREDKNIDYSFETSMKVEGTVDIEGEFKIGETGEEQNTWRTHPCIVSDMTVNGKKVVFKTGIEPKSPAKLYITTLPVEKFLGSEQECFLELENNFNEEAVFTFLLPEEVFVEFDRRSFELPLKARERVSIPMSYRLSDFGVYDKKVSVSALLSGEEKVIFTKEIKHAFRGTTGMTGWEGQYSWFMFNGPYIAVLNKNNNNVNVSCHIREGGVNFSMPKLGRPYSQEFSRKPPERVEYDRGSDWIAMKAFYYSAEFRGIELVRILKLYSNGIFQQYYEIRNTLDIVLPADICLDVNIHFSLHKAVIPYGGRYLELSGGSDSDMRYWDGGRVTENWLFARGERLPRGICWPETANMKFTGWALSFEKCFGKLAAGEQGQSETITVAFGTYQSWQDFKAFAQGAPVVWKPGTAPSLELIVNNGNPFADKNYDVLIKENRITNFNGQINLNSEAKAFERLVESFSEEEEARSALFSVPAARGYDTLECGIDFEHVAFEIKSGIFGMGDEPVKLEQFTMNNMETYSADNGELSIAASPEYSYGIFSMKYKGREWLDTLYPEKGPKSWWNPFVGGIGARLNAMPGISMLREKLNGALVNIKDNMGNNWSGLRLSVSITENETFKGLQYHQYFLMLPGLPVLCHVTGVIQNTGRFLAYQGLGTEAFFNPGQVLKNSWLKSKDKDGRLKTYKAGKASSHVDGECTICVGSGERPEMLQIYVNKERAGLGGSVDVNTISTGVSNDLVLKNGESCFTSPEFYIFTDYYRDAGELEGLNNISFSYDGQAT